MNFKIFTCDRYTYTLIIPPESKPVRVDMFWSKLFTYFHKTCTEQKSLSIIITTLIFSLNIMQSSEQAAIKRKISLSLPKEKVQGRLRKAYIQNGYRHLNLSARECLHSIFKWNNETANFWTHFVPCSFLICTYWMHFSEHSI